jgi:hypothetical protein
MIESRQKIIDFASKRNIVPLNAFYAPGSTTEGPITFQNEGFLLQDSKDGLLLYPKPFVSVDGDAVTCITGYALPKQPDLAVGPPPFADRREDCARWFFLQECLDPTVKAGHFEWIWGAVDGPAIRATLSEMLDDPEENLINQDKAIEWGEQYGTIRTRWKPTPFGAQQELVANDF